MTADGLDRRLMDYGAACDFHATAQGLDPITEALRAAGIPYAVDQTGGFCMLVRVPLTEGGDPYLYVSASEVDGTCVVGMYWDNCPNWHSEGEDVAYNLPIDHLAHSVRLLVKAPEALHACPYCEP